jgi:MoaA/NifB/PqqE/SkfB family radical SAM enzyme
MSNRKILINIESTPNCPARCSMCPRSSIQDSGFLSPEIAQQIADKLPTDMIRQISFAGRGEPTINKNLPELIKIFHKTGLPLAIVTTGVAVNEKLLEAIKTYNVKVCLSVSSYEKDVFDKVHIGLQHAKIWRNIKDLLSHNINTTIHLTGGDVIHDTLPQTVEKLREYGAKKIILLPLWNRSNKNKGSAHKWERAKIAKDNDIFLAESEYLSGVSKWKFLGQVILKKLSNFSYCPIGDMSLSISWDGKILGCFQDFGHSDIIGNISTHDIRTVLQNRHKDLGNFKICNGCDSKKVSFPV